MAAIKKNSKQFNPDGEIRDQGFAVHEGKTPAASVQLEPLEERVLFSADFIGLNPAEWSADTGIDDTQDATGLFDVTAETGIELILSLIHI